MDWSDVTSKPLPIAVIIAAYQAAGTIGRAVKSALASEHVAEVMVIDDASSDETAQAALDAAAGDARLTVKRQTTNQGPSAARNLAIRETTSPLIAILDADDFFLPGRFARILELEDWDMCADNIVFIKDPDELLRFDLTLDGMDPSRHALPLDFAHFVRGNISKRNRIRGELGFLKPIVRRDFLEHHGLWYHEDCRLGEDFILYTRALALGARMKVASHCGYAALIRPNSLSSRHSLEDLKALQNQCEAMLEALPLSPSDRATLQLHANSVRRKVALREVLRIRNENSFIEGVWAGIRNPTALADIAKDRLSRTPDRLTTPRFLMSDRSAIQAKRPTSP